MSRAKSISHAVEALATGAFESALARLVAIPTESQNPARAAILAGYLNGEVRPRLEELGFVCRLLSNPVDGPPFLFAERIEHADLPTVLGYGHADVIRGQEGKWREPLSPWTLTRVGDRLYGRGTADNKGQLTVNLIALAATLQARGGRLGWNAKFLVEAGEEIGSPGLHELCAQEQQLLRADVLIASDGPRVDPSRPTVFLGSRGALNFDLTVAPRAGAHHSGNWGGLLSNPAIVLAHAIAALVSATGRIESPELRPAGIPEDVRQALSTCVVSESTDGPRIDEWWGEPGLSAAEKVYGWNSFEVLAFTAGTPAAPVSAIPGNATARCQLRFVVGTDGSAIVPTIRRLLDEKGFGAVQVRASGEKPFVPTRVPLSDPWVKFARQSLSDTLGEAPDLLPNLGGSLPNDAFADLLNLPTIWIPHSYANCNQHAPDEHLLDSIVRQGLAVMAGLYWDLGEATPRSASPLRTDKLVSR
jgi:acetylornithine deacetylase/succinyl-diaminopimelate desuccinylase-like protein